jgi:hypothetical protein
MYSDRADDGIERTKESHFQRYNAVHPEKGGARKLSGGRTPAEVFNAARGTRKRIADTINEALEAHGFAERVDSRSLAERGIKRVPERPLGAKAVKHLAADARADIVRARAAAKNT